MVDLYDERFTCLPIMIGIILHHKYSHKWRVDPSCAPTMVIIFCFIQNDWRRRNEQTLNFLLDLLKRTRLYNNFSTLYLDYKKTGCVFDIESRPLHFFGFLPSGDGGWISSSVDEIGAGVIREDSGDDVSFGMMIWAFGSPKLDMDDGSPKAESFRSWRIWEMISSS